MKSTTKIGIIICDRYRHCAGGNIEYAGEEMVKNGAQVIRLATGLVVGYPPSRMRASRPLWQMRTHANGITKSTKR